MTKRQREKQTRNLVECLRWWIDKRAEAIEANDADALVEAECGYQNTMRELLKLYPRRNK